MRFGIVVLDSFLCSTFNCNFNIKMPYCSILQNQQGVIFIYCFVWYFVSIISQNSVKCSSF